MSPIKATVKRPHFLVLLLCLLAVTPPEGQAAVRFVTVEQGAAEFDSDLALHQRLDTLVSDAQPSRRSYEAVIDSSIQENPDPAIFRMTPYVYVAAEMQGANLDVLGTYLSKSTGKTTYHSYFVIRRDAFPHSNGVPPGLTQVVDWLRASSQGGDPARFLFHSRWSTSSYFLPSLFFRSQRIFSVADSDVGRMAGSGSDEPISEILLSRIDSDSSSELVRRVAATPGTFAAVWDGTRSKFLDQAEGEQVFFVRIPGELPNDLLVANPVVPDGSLLALRGFFEADVDLGETEGDVHAWLAWESGRARDAREALSVLRRRAAAPPSPIVVDIRTEAGESAAGEELLDAVRRAVRLSGTELVVKDDYYLVSDIEWTLTLIHDDALRLTVRYKDFDIDNEVVEQEFRLSYLSPEDLTRRIGHLIHNRIHRIRPLWQYERGTPTIIRDFDFTVPLGEPLPYQAIQWEDPASNNYTLVKQHRTRAVGVDFNKVRLAADGFPKHTDDSLKFEPMDRNEYRVLLIRPRSERDLFRYLTLVMLGLFFLAAAGAIWDLRRTARRTAGD
jgi:hypothetical protein